MNRVIPEMNRAPPKRIRPRAKLPREPTNSTPTMVTAATTTLLAIQRQKNFTNGLSWKTMNRYDSSVGSLTKYPGRKSSAVGVKDRSACSRRGTGPHHDQDQEDATARPDDWARLQDEADARHRIFLIRTKMNRRVTGRAVANTPTPQSILPIRKV